MLFDVYGENAIYQWLGMLGVLILLILLNEFERRTKIGGLTVFEGCSGAMKKYIKVVADGSA